MANNTLRRSSGFTIVELIVVISIVAVLAAITTLGYGAWQSSLRQNQVKSDLAAAAGAMEDARTFNDTYPLSLPGSYSASDGSLVVLSVPGLESYCIDGTHASDTSVEYYIDNLTHTQGAQEGNCAGREVAVALSAPAFASVEGFSGTDLDIAWSPVVGATGYHIQCSPDQSYIVILASTTVSGGDSSSHTFENVDPAALYYCRVKATNAAAESAWTSTGSSVNDGTYGSLPVAASIEGYWTSAPEGFLLEDGSAISRTTYADLFAVIGTTYGSGDGSTTFNLPDSRGRTTVNKNASDVEFATVGQETGSKAEQLTTGQIPSHTHTQSSHNHTQDAHNHGFSRPIGYSQGAGSYRASEWTLFTGRYDSATFSSVTATNQSTTAVNQSTGGGGTHNNIQPSIVKRAAIKYAQPSASAATLPEGSSISGYWSAAPTGFLIEDGTAVSRSTYSDLFAVIGTTYGSGDGSTTFNLPDSRGRVGVNISASDSEFDTMGEKPGSKRETLTIAQMPSHTHVQDAHTHVQNSHNHSLSRPIGYSQGAGSYHASEWLSFTGRYDGSATTSNTATNNAATATNQSTGGDESHNEIQPSIVKLTVIRHSSPTGSGKPVATATSMSGYWSTAPTGFLIEDGSAVSRTTYAALFAEIGTTYGSGDGSTTFNLPDSRGRVGVNISASDNEFDAMGEKYGTKNETVTISSLASHTHTQNSHTHTQNPHNHSYTAPIGYSQGNGAYKFSEWLSNAGSTDSFNTDAATATNQSTTAVNLSTGGGGTHNNIQPSIVRLFVIKY